ncbi:hypothetical protein SDC9_164617 [bioreactor metagenome]|uniref:Uncharacterized protein n=1 Tax=bioreactor metagenome TaxID=1076179 RepID=A0A645FZG4_9ZZZZ
MPPVNHLPGILRILRRVGQNVIAGFRISFVVESTDFIKMRINYCVVGGFENDCPPHCVHFGKHRVDIRLITNIQPVYNTVESRVNCGGTDIIGLRVERRTGKIIVRVIDRARAVSRCRGIYGVY